MTEKRTDKWWQDAVAYQIYPKSFKDSNGDGIGDLNGIREKIGYLKDLGVDFVWLNPVYQSPNVDNGYDISDYQAINPEFGTMDDMTQLIEEAHANGIKVIMDLVINHTSDQHPWFLEACKGEDNPYHDYYIWSDTAEKPNDWQSIFGGSVWEYVPSLKKNYFHVFAKEQPDLNWENKQMRESIFRMIRWWLDQGIDGFRIDAISHIKKSSWETKARPDWPHSPFTNVKGIGKYLKELSAVFKEYDIVTVGEASGVTAEEATEWVGNDGYFNMIFEFEHISLWQRDKSEAVDVVGLKRALGRWQKALDYGEGWNALYMENHDVPRSVSVFGNDTPQYWARSAKALATMYLLLQGTPFIYQGQELGMPNMTFTAIDQLDDVTAKNQIKALLGEKDQATKTLEILELMSSISRDNSRTPMQWDKSDNAGFSTAKPWMAVNPNHKTINVAQQKKESSSILNYYKQLIKLRKSKDVLAVGHYEDYLPTDEQVYVYERFLEHERVLVIVNLTKEQAEIRLPQTVLGKNWSLLLTNMEEDKETSAVTETVTEKMTLEPYQTLVYAHN
ncbi:glycoside hydrolase family 13 protein [Bavariicoccus seileri]|uniref:glycoside hydrolase family 13 protein n=1 Tax=Bavariicoccus seileri TaxID=549685 RepID=UPI003F9164C0